METNELMAMLNTLVCDKGGEGRGGTEGDRGGDTKGLLEGDVALSSSLLKCRVEAS